MNTHTEYLAASDGKQLALHAWLPDTDIQAVLHISHGMAEYAKRYAPFGTYLAENGIAVFAHDHRGHGETAGTLDATGFLAEKDGFNRVVLDLHEVISALHQRFPGKKIFLCAHSFGSFVGQAYIERYGAEISGCILSGTAGPRPLLGNMTCLLASFLAVFQGTRHRSVFLNTCAFGAYNRRIPKPHSPSAWLSRDAGEVQAYDNSPWCGFIPTVSFFRDLGYGLAVIHTKAAMSRIPHNLPVFIVCGTDDPVGSYSKTVRKLVRIYRKNGISDLTEKYYDGGRHEMLNETNKTEVQHDILSWLKAH